MANTLYTQNFTLNDIFSNKKLRGKLPLISYAEGETPKGRLSQRTSVKSVGALVYENSKTSARPFYKPLNARKNGNYISIGGKTDTDLDTVVDAIFVRLLGIKQMLIMTANDTDILREAMKEAGRQKRATGQEPKLWLRVGSMQQLEQMSDRDRNKVINDIMKNVFFGSGFPETQKKFGVAELLQGGRGYDRRKREWLKEIGEL